MQSTTAPVRTKKSMLRRFLGWIWGVFTKTPRRRFWSKRIALFLIYAVLFYITFWVVPENMVGWFMLAQIVYLGCVAAAYQFLVVMPAHDKREREAWIAKYGDEEGFDDYDDYGY